MELRTEHIAINVTRAVLAGRWDIQGAAKIELQLSAITGAGRAVIIDMSEVSFLSSMGIRSIVMAAKATVTRGGKFALMSPGAAILEVLTTAGIDQIVPIHHDLDQAMLSMT